MWARLKSARRSAVLAVLTTIALVVSLTSASALAGAASPSGDRTSSASIALAAAAPVGSSALVAWGSNDSKQLGNNSTVDSNADPVAVTTTGALAGKTVTAVSAGSAHACAIAAGSAYCWGLNSNGQLGNGAKIDSAVPVAVTSSGVLAGKTVTAISAGAHHTCAVADGRAYCWGSAADSVLGNGSTTDSSVPVAVNTTGALAGKTVTAISAGADNTCAVAAAAAYCWGFNANGQLGNGSIVDSALPVAVNSTGALSGKTVTAISVGTVPNTTVCAVASGSAYCWGANSTGAVGDGTTADRLTPVAVSTAGALGTQTLSAISVGGYSTCAVAAGKAYCWGANEFGELGDSSTTNRLAPVPVDTTGALSGKVVTSLTTRGLPTGNPAHPVLGHSCAVASGQAYCWGANQYGQLGASTTSYQSSTPVAVTTAGALAGRAMWAVSLGEVFSVALTAPSASDTPGAFVSLAPSRLLDTRVNVGVNGPVQALGSVSLQVTGKGGVPLTGVAAVALNVTAVTPTGAGYITVWPSGKPMEQTSNLNFSASQTIPNMVIVPVGADGKIQLYNGSFGTVHLLADVAGYIVSGTPALPGTISTLAPTRIMDTRVNVGVNGPVQALGSVSLQVTGKGGVPLTGVAAVALNVTAVTPTGAGYITVWPSGKPMEQTSNLNFSASQTIPNMVIVPVGADGKIQLYNGSFGTVHLLADVAGYIVSGTPALPGTFSTLAPTRIMDTRVNAGVNGPVQALGSVSLQVTGKGGVPLTGVAAVALNVTAVTPTGAGYITVWPSGKPMEQTSNLNFSASQTIPNMVIVPVGADGKIQLYNGSFGTVHLLADVAGYVMAS